MHYRGLANTQRTASHNEELKQFMNSVGNVQICRVLHPSTPSPTRSLCAPLSDSCFRDSCNSHHQTCLSITPTQQQGLATLWTHPRSFVHYYFFHTRVICLPRSSLFFSLFCLPRQLATHAVDTFNSARQQDRNEVWLLCWNMLVGIKYSAADRDVWNCGCSNQTPGAPSADSLPLSLPSTLHPPQDSHAESSPWNLEMAGCGVQVSSCWIQPEKYFQIIR